MLFLRRQAITWLEAFFLPALAVFLPWRLAFRIYRRLAAQDWLFHEQTTRALAAAGRQGYAPADDWAWARDYRLVHLVDRADGYLSRFRGQGWLDRHVHISGDAWPNGAFIGVTFHYGAGLWSIRDLRRRGRRASFLSTRFDAASFPGAWIRYVAARWRMREVARISGAPVIYTGGSVDRIRATLAGNIAVLGLLDVPAAQTTLTVPVRFLGRTARFPPGLVRIAREAKVPLALFLMTVDMETGARHLLVRLVAARTDEDAMEIIIRELEEALRRHSPSWHRWGDVLMFFDPEGT